MAVERVLEQSRGKNLPGRTIGGRDHLLAAAAGLYVFVWIVEGALRKWIPQVDSLLYVGRDLILILALCVSLVRFGPSPRKRAFTVTFWTLVAIFCAMGALEVIVRGSPLSIAIFGVRNYIAPLLLPFVIFRDQISTFTQTASRILVYFAPAQLLLVLWQVNSPASALVNVQTGGEEAYFTTSGGVVRAAGTFSAPAGLIAYLTLAMAASLVLVLSRQRRNVIWGWIGVGAVVLMIALAGSRSAVFYAALVAVGWLVYLIAQRRLKHIGIALFGALTAWAALYVAITGLPGVFDAFLVRFDLASQSENTLGRVLESFVVFASAQTDVFGAGIGVHSTIGVSLGSGLEWIESDSARGVKELGALGIGIALARVVASAYLMIVVLLRPRSSSATEYLFSAIALSLLLAGSITTQPSTQGQFGIVLAMIAAAAAARRREQI